MQRVVVAIVLAGTGTGATIVGHLSDRARRRRVKSRRERADYDPYGRSATDWGPIAQWIDIPFQAQCCCNMTRGLDMRILNIAGTIALSVAPVLPRASAEGTSDHPIDPQIVAESFRNLGVDVLPDTNGSALQQAEAPESPTDAVRII